MKKYFALVLSMIFVLGFAASAFAIHAEIPSETQAVVAKGTTQIYLGGELRFRGWYTNNVGSNTLTFWNDIDNDGVIDAGPETDSKISFPTLYLPADYKGSARIDLNDGSIHDLTLSPTDSDAWYDARVRLNLKADISQNTTGYIALETGSATSDVYTWGALNSKQGGPTYILEAWIQHKGSGLLGIPAGIKVGHMPLALGEKQFLDHTKFGDDAIVFFMDPTKEIHIGLITAKLAEGDLGLAGDDIDGYVGLMTYKIDKNNTVGINYTYVQNTNAARSNDGLSFSNLGFHGSGKIAGLSYAAEVDFQFGKLNKGTSSEQKFRGWGVFANLGYKVDPVNIRAGFAMGSGDSDLNDNKIKEFQTTMGRDIHYAFVYEYTLTTSAVNQVIEPRSRNTSIANTTYYRLGLDYSPVKDLSTSLDGFIIRATKTPDSSISKSVGWEVDLKASYKIDRNLTYSVIAGYFKPGKFYEDMYLDAVNLKKKSVLQAVHALTLSF